MKTKGLSEGVKSSYINCDLCTYKTGTILIQDKFRLCHACHFQLIKILKKVKT